MDKCEYDPRVCEDSDGILNAAVRSGWLTGPLVLNLMDLYFSSLCEDSSDVCE